jgi:hypothetical protein
MDCGGTNNARIARQIAQGVDHDLGESKSTYGPPPYPVPLPLPPVKADIDACNQSAYDAKPWTLREAQTGNRTGVVHDGLFAGTAGIPGLLTNTAGSMQIVTLKGIDVDDTGLWQYLNPGPGAPPSCAIGVAVDKATMIQCLDDYKMTNSNADLFDESIADNPRWAWAPLLVEFNFPPGQSDPVNIFEFRNVWLQTTLWKCNANACDAIHEAGEGVVGMVNGNDQLEAVSALQIPRTALPKTLEDTAPGRPGRISFVIIN